MAHPPLPLGEGLGVRVLPCNRGESCSNSPLPLAGEGLGVRGKYLNANAVAAYCGREIRCW